MNCRLVPLDKLTHYSRSFWRMQLFLIPAGLPLMRSDGHMFLFSNSDRSVGHFFIIIAFDRRVGQKMEKRDNGPTAAREKLGSSSGEVRDLVGK